MDVQKALEQLLSAREPDTGEITLADISETIDSATAALHRYAAALGKPAIPDSADVTELNESIIELHIAFERLLLG